jgi:hypothetical protein
VPAGPGKLERRLASPFDGRVPSSNRLRAPLCRARTATRGGPSRASCSHRVGCISRERESADYRRGLRFPHRPAKSDAFPRTPRCVPPFCACPRPRGSLPAFVQVGLSSTQHLRPEEHRRFAARESLRLFNHPVMPGLTSQATGAAQSNGTKGWLLPPSRTPRSQRSRRLL